MNYAQFALFVVYACSLLIAGIGIYATLGSQGSGILNRCVYIGEALLLGSTFLVGELLLLSLFGFYKASYLWGIVLLNFLFVIRESCRRSIFNLLTKKIRFDIPFVIFGILVLWFLFRNCYFMVDIDSHSTYLFAQKLWLSAESSLVRGIDMPAKVFAPHFDAVPYSLGLSIFGQETLFPELVNILWRLIVLLLVYGYTSYRFNRYYGLCASMFCFFNEHFFYSGVNLWVIINGAVIAFLFAAAYNFWECRRPGNLYRIVLALIFLSQLMSNKYQMLYCMCFLLILGIVIQPAPLKIIGDLFRSRKYMVILGFAWAFTALWYFKNWLVTGDPAFPVLAGRFHAFGWTYDQWNVFVKVRGGLGPATIVKYLNYLFIWPGIAAAKYIMIAVTFLPLIILGVGLKSRLEKDDILELSFWLSLSVLMVFGICLSNHQDPRYYRYAIAIMSFSVVLVFNFVFKNYIGAKWRTLTLSIMLVIPLLGGMNEGFKIIFFSSGPFKYPSLADNLNVIRNKIHMGDVIERYYPQTNLIRRGLQENQAKSNRAAWNAASLRIFSYFLMPAKPVISLSQTNVIKWDSYDSESSIVRDLKNFGIDWLIECKDGELRFTSAEDYAKVAVQFDRHPKNILYDYGFPPELSEINW